MSEPAEQSSAADLTQRITAFESIVTEYERQLLHYTARIVLDHDAAQDIVQDAFIKLFRNWRDKMEPSTQILTWLYKVSHNRAIDYLRKRSRRRLLHLRHSKEHPTVTKPDRGEGFKISDRAVRAVAALRKLSPREQQLVILKVYEEKSYKDISDITGLTTSNVGYILHHAMRRMAEILKQAGDK